MNIKNYTSSVPVATTVARIEQMIADAGATGIRKEFVAEEKPDPLPAPMSITTPCELRGIFHQ